MGLTLSDTGFIYAAGTRYARRALGGVDLTVERGELVLVLGATGSGKTTLLRVASGVFKPTEGSATIAGLPVTGPGDADRDRRIGLVFQNPETQLFAETVFDDVAFGPRNLDLDDPDARARQALIRVALDPEAFGSRSPFALSGGEARRVALAGVLAMDPAWLMLDEPTAGLDASGRRAVLDSVRGARDTAGVVVVTHDAEELLAEADRVLVLADGRVAHLGPSTDLVRDPAIFESAGLLAPDVLRAQQLAAEAGRGNGGSARPPAFTLDLAAAAAGLDAMTGAAS